MTSSASCARCRSPGPRRPDLAGAACGCEPRRRAGAPRAAVAVALSCSAALAAVEPARSAVLEFLGLKSVRIERREPVATPAPPGADLGLGEPAARTAASPAGALGDAGRRTSATARSITFVYGDPPDLLVMQAPATVTPFIQKSIGPGVKLERFRVDGDPAYFISGARTVSPSRAGRRRARTTRSGWRGTPCSSSGMGC